MPSKVLRHSVGSSSRLAWYGYRSLKSWAALLVRVRGDEDCALHDAKAVYRKQVRGQRLANNRILRALELSGGWHSTIAPHFSAMIERQGIAVILERSIFQGCGGNGLPFTRPT